jgi:general nucleoside transport system permease protein
VLRLELRKTPSTLMLYLTPVLALLICSLIGGAIFTLIGYQGGDVVFQLFLKPLLEPHRYPALLVKAAPLILIAVGLSIGFRANVWNIGAEGQYVMGGIFATFIAIQTDGLTGFWILPLMLAMAMLGGALWAYPVAILKNRFNVSEILTSLMLTYVSIQGLFFLMRGWMQDPAGFNFPQSIMFGASQSVGMLYKTIHYGVPIAFLLAFCAWFMLSRTVTGYSIRAAGMAPEAARYAGFSRSQTVTFSMLVSGGLAGLAGGFDVAGPYGQLVPQFPNNYGFTAIIVAFLGRLHPVGCIFGALVIAITAIGGELAQTLHRLPQAATLVFQALLLFLILALDVLVNKRIVFK